ncbi:putative ABC transporter permease [Paenibacillus crassostreae]|uniref:ABC transporter permease n=1 Tax=Paenibacillus crassostreae TaxID=1763538 RepID=A0A167GS69_9BACL|nr:putative ABC transporter permease [Paenibacillus crassostreae]AOZ92042.1 hypothetical protein LPB68_07285 [Paenibacillus crassostreae]OAB77851.1 hypothetical protein PNBC_00365 [Paenibacillus crassostreae]
MTISTIEELTFYFMLYSFAGWVLENCHSWLTHGQFWKEGLLKGPFKPMYGFAPLLLIIISEYPLHWLYILLFSMVVPTLIEYVSGVMLHLLFHKRWWDYSNHSIQLHGHICLRFSIYWCPLSLTCLYVLHPRSISLYTQMASIWAWLFPIFLIYLLVDVVWSGYNWRALVNKPFDFG